MEYILVPETPYYKGPLGLFEPCRGPSVSLNSKELRMYEFIVD